MTGGLKRTAPTPVPVGWDEDPETLGSLIADLHNHITGTSCVDLLVRDLGRKLWSSDFRV